MSDSHDEQEINLEREIDDYKKQIAQIDLVLSDAEIPIDRNEFINLKKDLEELLKLSEETLLDLKKNKLLAQLNLFVEPSEKIATTSHSESIEHVDEDDSDLIGTKCRVYYECKSTGVKMHNCIVLGIDSEADQTIRVLFCNPTEMRMKICEHFMNNQCKFDTNCKYSHGYQVKIDDMHTYLEPCFDNLNKGVVCLAKHTDNLWHLAEIQSHDEQFIYVQFKKFNQLSKLEWHDVLVLDLPDNDDLSDNQSDNLSELFDIDDDNQDQEIKATSSKNSSLNQYRNEMGNWEKYTKGIGSKLLIKMGYVIGKGLGKEGEGRVEPVEVTVLPGGVSLDRAFELKKKKKKFSKKISNKKPQDNNNQHENVFEFINTKLIKDDTMTTSICSSSSSNIDSSGKTLLKKELSKAKDLNLKMLNTHNRIQQEEKNNSKLKESLNRNRNNCDKATLDRIRDKIEQSDRLLEHLKQSEMDILNEKNKRKRKSEIF